MALASRGGVTGEPMTGGENRSAGGAPEGAFVSGPVTTRDAALFTDLYEVTMAASYFRERMHGAATFSLFVRKLPEGRAFLVAAGLEDVLTFLQGFRFSPEAIE